MASECGSFLESREMSSVVFMAGASGGYGFEVALDSSQSPSKISPTKKSFDNAFSVVITAFKINGRKFIPWSGSIQLLIRGKGKQGFLDGLTPQLALDDPSLETWETNNSLVMSGLYGQQYW